VTTLGLIDTLRKRGVIPADAPAAPSDAVDRPWFIALLQGVAGWLAGIFLLVFVGLMFKPDSAMGIFILGVALLAGAWALYFADRNAVFLDQLALAISVAGQFAVVWSISKDSPQALTIAATMLVLQIAVLTVMPNKIARTLAALFACIAWTYTVRFLLRPARGEQLFFDYDGMHHPPLLGGWTIPVGWLLTWVPLLALLYWLMTREAQWMATGLRNVARPVLTGLLLGLALGGVTTEPFAVFVLGVEVVGMPFSWWALFPLLSIALAMVAAYCAFRLRSVGLLGVAVVAALVHLSRLYYLYGTTLMWKSVIMLGVGVVLLLAGAALQRSEARPGSAA
jgi:hypothetical protein